MGLWKSKFGPSPPEITGEARMILRRVGLALIVFGLLDIGVMVYSIANGVNYSSSFNVFAVLAGIYVRRGNPLWVKWTTRAAGFYAAAFCAMLLIGPFLFPRDLGALEFRLHPVGVIAGAIASIGVIAFLIWVHGDAEQRAIMLATAKMGPGYHYFVTSISYADDRGSAEVLAYDDRAVRTVKVEW